MRLVNVPLGEIDWNPWRDKKIFPIEPDHVAELVVSIKVHGFFASVKGRRSNGRVQIGCGHARFEAAKRARLETMPIYIDDIDDDGMLRLMTDENATQSGNHAGAILNEVAAVTERLIDGLLGGGTFVPPPVAKAFENKAGIEQARSKLRNGSNVHMVLGHNIIRRYLGESSRGERQIREAISALKQSGTYDDIVDKAVARHPPPMNVLDYISPKRDVGEPKVRRERILDERTASVFENDHQFHAFREAITTGAAQRVIPVNQQFALAKDIVKPGSAETSNRKQISASYIKMKVNTVVQDGLKQQRDIDKKEREAYLAEEIDNRIEAELQSANSSVRSLLSALGKLNDLARKHPGHPRIGGFAAKLDELAVAIKQFSKAIK